MHRARGVWICGCNSQMALACGITTPSLIGWIRTFHRGCVDFKWNRKMTLPYGITTQSVVDWIRVLHRGVWISNVIAKRHFHVSSLHPLCYIESESCTGGIWITNVIAKWPFHMETLHPLWYAVTEILDNECWFQIELLIWLRI